MKGSESSVRGSGVAWRYGGGWAPLAYLQSAEIVAGGNGECAGGEPSLLIAPDLDRPGVTRRGCGRRADFATICGKMAR